MLNQYQIYPISAEHEVAMANFSSAKKADARYVFVFWNNQFPDQYIFDFVMRLHEAGIEVKIINAAESVLSSLGSGSKRYQLQPNTTLDEAIALTDHALCAALPHNRDLLAVTLSLPNIEIFIRKAAENNAILIGNAEIVAPFALYKTAEKSIDLIYPDNQDKLRSLMNRAVMTLKSLLGK